MYEGGFQEKICLKGRAKIFAQKLEYPDYFAWKINRGCVSLAPDPTYQGFGTLSSPRYLLRSYNTLITLV